MFLEQTNLDELQAALVKAANAIHAEMADHARSARADVMAVLASRLGIFEAAVDELAARVTTIEKSLERPRVQQRLRGELRPFWSRLFGPLASTMPVRNVSKE